MSTEAIAQPDAGEQWLDIDGYAALVAVSRSTIRDAVTARRIHFSRVGRHVRFSPLDRQRNEELLTTAPVKTPAAVAVVRHLPARRRAS
jgi:excisionase family DNA binding protein